MAKNVVLTDKNGEEIMPVTTSENVFVSDDKTALQAFNDINNSLDSIKNYSTNETFIGFYNGYPLYKKVIPITLPDESTQSGIFLFKITDTYSVDMREKKYNSGITNINKLLRFDVISNATATDSIGFVQANAFYNTSQIINVWYDKRTNVIDLRERGYDNCEALVIMEYTKYIALDDDITKV